MKLTDRGHLRTYWALDLAEFWHLLMVAQLISSSEFVLSYLTRFCLFWLRAIWFLMGRGNLVSFLSDKKRGHLFYTFSVVNPPMSYWRDSSENSWSGPESRTAGPRRQGLFQLYTFVYQVEKESPSWHLLKGLSIQRIKYMYIHFSPCSYTCLILWHNYKESS